MQMHLQVIDANGRHRGQMPVAIRGDLLVHDGVTYLATGKVGTARDGHATREFESLLPGTAVRVHLALAAQRLTED